MAHFGMLTTFGPAFQHFQPVIRMKLRGMCSYIIDTFTPRGCCNVSHLKKRKRILQTTFEGDLLLPSECKMLHPSSAPPAYRFNFFSPTAVHGACEAVVAS